MRDPKGSILTVVLVAAALMLIPPAAYIGGYFALTMRTTRNTQTGGKCRVYRSSWQAMMFLPATLVESAVTGSDVAPAWPSPGP
jgi:hypothetical protein